MPASQLVSTLHRIDNKGYGAYVVSHAGRCPPCGACDDAACDETQTKVAADAIADVGIMCAHGVMCSRYKDIQGRAYDFGGAGLAPFALHVDHVQGDAYAPPSRMHVTLPLPAAGFPAALLSSTTRCVAVADFCARVFHRCGCFVFCGGVDAGCVSAACWMEHSFAQAWCPVLAWWLSLYEYSPALCLT